MRESGWKRGWNTERWKGERVSERAEEIKNVGKKWKEVYVEEWKLVERWRRGVEGRSRE